MDVLLEDELLSNLITFLLLTSCSFIIGHFEEVSDDVEFLVEGSFDDSTRPGHKLFKPTLLHLNLAIFLSHQLEAFHEFFLFALGLFFFGFRDWGCVFADERATNEATSLRQLFTLLSSELLIWASSGELIEDLIPSHIRHILLAFLIMLLLFLDCLEMLYHVLINDTTLNLTVVCNWFFLDNKKDIRIRVYRLNGEIYLQGLVSPSQQHRWKS